MSTTVDSESVTTFVISDVAGVDDSFLDEDSGYKLFNADSDLVLDKDDDSLVQNKNSRDKVNQEWKFVKITDGNSHTEKYKIVHAESGEVLTNNDGSLVLDSDNDLAEQQWIISTNGLGEYTIVGVDSDQVIEVVGESSDEGEAVDLYQPNSGNN